MNHTLPIGQGHGVAGRYAGLPDSFCDPHSSKIAILPIPFDLTTTYQKGSEKGPEALIEASRNMELYDIETDSEVYKLGIFTDQAIHAESSIAMLESAYRRTQELLKQGQFVVVIGGEHSISYAPIKAHAEHYGTLTVLQFDAHADLQNTYENNPWSHACVMARIKEIPEVKQISSIGIRSMSADELPRLDRQRTFYAHELNSSSYWMERLLEQLTGPIYITFDLDVFDSSIMPSTGTPEPGGLNWVEVTTLLKLIAKKKNIVGCDVVELCPSAYNLAPDYLAAKLIYKILSYKFYASKLPHEVTSTRHNKE